MRQIKVFVISLKKSITRQESISHQLKSQNIDFEFFDAIDGNEDNFLKFKKYNYLKTLWLTSGKTPLKGEIGCYASHFSLWEKCLELNEPIIIIEDDARIVKGAGELLVSIQKQINHYGLLRLEKAGKGKVSLIIRENEIAISYLHFNFNGARSYAITPNASRALLECRDWCMPVDNYIGSNYLHKVPSFLFFPSLVINAEEFETTIQSEKRNKCPFYRKPTRELYSLYRKIALKVMNRKLYCESNEHIKK